jgi:DNA-binding transcriptional regulator of glucitol operon
MDRHGAVEEEPREVEREPGARKPTGRDDANGQTVATPTTRRDAEALDAAATLRKLLTPRWIAFTLFVAVAVVVCLALGWWQLSRFDSQNGDWQNLGYSLEWPFFAAFAIYVWWKLLREPPASDEEEGSPDRGDSTRADAVPEVTRPRLTADDPEDAELAAYNRYLAALHERSRRQERSR